LIFIEKLKRLVSPEETDKAVWLHMAIWSGLSDAPKNSATVGLTCLNDSPPRRNLLSGGCKMTFGRNQRNGVKDSAISVALMSEAMKAIRVTLYLEAID
jgi:hypothetical protein